ncbi:MAG: hypothetical protein Q9228_006823 [Teloschistes exilis]
MKTFIPWTFSTAAVAVAAFGTHDLQQPLTSAVSEIPGIGFGTWLLDKSNVSEAVSAAIQTGYRHIDCATIYGNQKEVGKGIADGLKKANLKRSDIWITSKLWNDHHEPKLAVEALQQTLVDLGIEYLDLWLMHWPVSTSPKTGKTKVGYLDAWHTMEKLHKTPQLRNIGVSNFSPSELKDLIDRSSTVPAVHQFEIHPYLPQTDFLDYHRELGIQVTAYSPFANTNPIYKPQPDDPPHLLTENLDMLAIAAERGCTTAQVALVWGRSRGCVVIPKASHVEHIKENFRAVECRLTDEDLERVDWVSDRYLKRFNNPSESWGVKLYDGLQDS